MASPERLIEVFNEAKSRSAGTERDRYLAEACGDDPQFMEQVLSLLRAHEGAGVFLQATIALPPEIEVELARLKPERAGDRIGPYKLREQIGEGGFGVVWVAEQENPVRRTVALKIIKLGMATRDVVARFEQERQALAMMDHPNIARVFDAGVTDHGRPFFVMELVRGIKITDYCDEANLPTVERLQLFIEVCHAVQHAHQKGIIHRDLKPSNVLVTLHDSAPVPKIIDFGVAKATQGRLVEQTIYTQFQQVIGTPLYMSPEQVEMSGLDVDTRADIYVLGVLLYELLTGRTPFDADTLMRAGYDEMRRVIREQEPPKPSTALDTMAEEKLTTVAHHRRSEPPKLLHAVRGDLDWIVMKCLEKDRTHRYETANGLASDIQRYLDNEPVVARPPSKAYQFQKFARRNKLAFAAATAITTALVVGLTTTTWMYLRESAARKRAMVAEELATERLAEAEAVSTFMSEVFQSPDPARDGRTITVAETLDKAVQKLETDLANQPARRARLQSTLGWTYFSLGLPHMAIPLHVNALDYHRARSGPEHTDTLWGMHDLAHIYAATGRGEEALRLREEVVAIRRKKFPPEHPDMLAAMSSLADSYVAAGRLEEALKIREEVLPLRRKVSGPERLSTIWAMQNLANSYYSVGRRGEALKLREELLPLCRKALGPEYPTTLAAMFQLANSYADAHRQDEALKLREEAMPLFHKVLGPEHHETLSAMSGLASTYAAIGRQVEALKLREELVPLCSKVRGPEHVDTLWAMRNLAYSYHEAGRRDEALKLREEVVPLFRRVSGPKHANTLWAIRDLADSYSDAGRRDEALQLREEVLPLVRGISPERPDTLWLMKKLAHSYHEAGRRDEALKLREEVLPLFRKVRGREHSETLWAVKELADCYLQAGRVAEAIPLLADISTRKPEDTVAATKIAALQVWFAMDAEYEATCQRMLQWAANSGNRQAAQHVAKFCSLHPIDDASLQQATLALAQRTVDLGNGKTDNSPWPQLTLGMAEYRSGHYPAADKALTTTAKTASATGAYRPDVVAGTASFYRVMSLYKQGRQAEARELFSATEVKMKPLPADEKNPLADGESNHDNLILWLAYKEARALLNSSPVKQP